MSGEEADANKKRKERRSPKVLSLGEKRLLDRLEKKKRRVLPQSFFHVICLLRARIMAHKLIVEPKQPMDAKATSLGRTTKRVAVGAAVGIRAISAVQPAAAQPLLQDRKVKRAGSHLEPSRSRSRRWTPPFLHEAANENHQHAVLRELGLMT